MGQNKQVKIKYYLKMPFLELSSFVKNTVNAGTKLELEFGYQKDTRTSLHY